MIKNSNMYILDVEEEEEDSGWCVFGIICENIQREMNI